MEGAAAAADPVWWLQNKWSPGAERLRQAGLDVNPRAKPAAHGVISLIEGRRLLCERGVDPELGLRVARSVAAHHGEFPTDAELNAANVPAELGRHAAWRSARDALAEMAAAFAGVGDRPVPMPEAFADAGFFVLLAGLATVADWIGSMAEVFVSVDA